MRKISIFAMLIIVFLAGCSNGKNQSANGETYANKLEEIKDTGKVVIGIKYDAPLLGFKNPETGNVEGLEIDIAKELGNYLVGETGDIELKEVTAKTRVEMLKNGDVDFVLATMQITDERKKEIDFSDAYFTAGQTLLVPVDSPIKNVEDINSADKTIVAVKGSAAEQVMRANGWKTKIKEYENLGETFTALKNKKGDAFMNHNSIQAGMVEQSKVDGKAAYRIVGPPITEDEVGIGVKKGNEELLQEINGALKEIKENGKYEEIYDKWFSEYDF